MSFKCSGEEEKISVRHAEVILEVQKLKSCLLDIADNCFSLQNEKTQLELSVQERKSEIDMAHSIEEARLKIEKEELSALNMEVKERVSNVIFNFCM